MKRFYKSLTILLSLVVAIVGAISNLNFQSNNEVKAVGYNTQTTNNNYTTLDYSGNLFENEIFVLTTDMTTSFKNLWDNELSSGFKNYLTSNGYPYGSYLRVYVDDVIVGNFYSRVSSLGAGNYDIKFGYQKDSSTYAYSPSGTFTVVDNTPPVITGTLIYNSSVDSPITINSIISGLTAIDNVNGDVSSSIVVKTDNYSEYKNKVGTYYVVFTAEDSLSNKSEISVRINVVDNSTSTSITGILGLIKKVFDFIVNIFKSIFGL